MAQVKGALGRPSFDLRKQNDADLTQDQTVKLRGRIAEVKKILSLGMTAEIIED